MPTFEIVKDACGCKKPTKLREGIPYALPQEATHVRLGRNFKVPQISFGVVSFVEGEECADRVVTGRAVWIKIKPESSQIYFPELDPSAILKLMAGLICPEWK